MSIFSGAVWDRKAVKPEFLEKSITRCEISLLGKSHTDVQKCYLKKI